MAKMTRASNCQICEDNEAVWAMQFIGEDKPTFYVLGWHIRGFRVTKVCDGCKQTREIHEWETEMEKDEYENGG